MLGKGLFKGLKITGYKFFKKKITEAYPEVKPNLPSRSRGNFDFKPETCISCNLCANACPSRVISVESTTGETGKKVLQDYKMNLAHCMYCGLCTEACPTGSLNFTSDFEHAVFDRKDIIRSWEGPGKRKPGPDEEQKE